MRIYVAQAIGADDAYAVAARDIDEFLLPCRTLCAGFGKIGGNDHGAARAGTAAIFQRGCEVGGRQSQQADIDRVTCSGELRDCGYSQNFCCNGMHRDDASAITMLQQKVHDTTTELCGVAGCADYGNAARVEYGPQCGNSWIHESAPSITLAWRLIGMLDAVGPL